MMMKSIILSHKVISLLIFCGMTACVQKPKVPVELDQTPITVNVPAKISNDVLSITLPKCALDLDKKELTNNELISDTAILTYDIFSYSGNLNNRFECEKTNPIGLNERNELNPIYPLADGQSINSGYDYLVKFSNALGSKVIDERPFVQKRNVNASQEMLLINNMPRQTTPFKLTYFKYDGSINSPPSYNYRILTIINDKYYFQYALTILVPENRHGHNLPNYNTDFAEKFRDVIQSKGNVLDHPELIQGFVDNNERVVKFINERSTMSKQDKK